MTAVHSRWWGWTGVSRGTGTREPKGARARDVGTWAGGKKGLLLPQLRDVRQR